MVVRCTIIININTIDKKNHLKKSARIKPKVKYVLLVKNEKGKQTTYVNVLSNFHRGGMTMIENFRWGKIDRPKPSLYIANLE